MIVSRISGEEIRSHYLTNKDGSISIPDLLHLQLMQQLRLTDSEYDKFIEIFPEDDFISMFHDHVNLTISDKKYILSYINKCKSEKT